MWENCVCQLLNVLYVYDVRPTEMHTDEPLVHEPSTFETEIAIEKLKKYTSPAMHHGLAEMIQQQVLRYINI